MDIIGKIFKRFEKKEEKLEFDVNYRNEYILISIKSNGKIISIEDVNDDDILSFSESDIFDISDDKSKLILDYENIYDLGMVTREILNLPPLLDGAIYIDNSTYFLNANGLKFNYTITDGFNEYRIISKNYISNKENNEKYFLEKEQYNLIKLIDAYNKDNDTNKLANEQYKLLSIIKDTSHKANVILNDQIKLTGLQVVYDLDEKCVKYPNTGKDDYDVTVVFPITTELRNHIEQSVLKQYMKEVKKLTPKQG